MEAHGQQIFNREELDLLGMDEFVENPQEAVVEEDPLAAVVEEDKEDFEYRRPDLRRCNVCFGSFDTVRRAQYHRTEHQGHKLSCPKCGYVYINQRFYLWHYSIHHARKGRKARKQHPLLPPRKNLAYVFRLPRLPHLSRNDSSSSLVENIGESVGIGQGVSKLYATIDLKKARVGRTRLLENEPNNPRWYESFHIYCAHFASDIIFTVKDDNPIGATLIGRAFIPVGEVLGGGEVDRWLEILVEDCNPVNAGSKIHVKLQYFEVTEDHKWARRVSLYQDTAFHSIFRTLNTVHHDDLHQPNVTGAAITKGGPMEPWHDIHCRLEGPIAWDVLFNFEQRWRKEGGKDILVKLRELGDIMIPRSPVMFLEDHETWNVQLFRSIDSGAAFGFPDTPEDAAKAGLISGKENIIDRSIQYAYINDIRRSKNFIYIENQYFLGSSFCWKADDIKPVEVGALHLPPKELSLKIVSKIEAGERFAVYVVVPMWPEGLPESGPVQAILDWQRRTLEMMYTDITQALKAKGIEADPREYLTLFCLGNREVKKEGEYVPSEEPEPDTDYIRAQLARRFMIYVHTKMMIGRDESIVMWRIQDVFSGSTTDSGPAKSQGSKGEVGGDKSAKCPSIGALGIYQGHDGTVEHVQPCPSSLQELCSVGYDSCLILWAARCATSVTIKISIWYQDITEFDYGLWSSSLMLWLVSLALNLTMGCWALSVMLGSLTSFDDEKFNCE